MKILLINKFHYLRGGCERHVFDLAASLEKEGYRVIHFSMQDSRNFRSVEEKYFIEKVEFDKFSFRSIGKIFYNRDAVHRLKRLIAEEKPDIAHLHNFAHHFSPAIISLLKKNNIPMVQTLHDYKMICPNYRLYNQKGICESCRGEKYYNCVRYKCLKNSYPKSILAMLEAYWSRFLGTYEKIDLFIAPSRYMRDTCIRFGISGNRIRVMCNAVSQSISNQSSSSNTNHLGSYILYFGRLSHEKGVDILVQAMSEIENKNLCLKIAGVGPDQKEIRDLIEKHDLSNRVEMLGFKSGQDLADLISGARAIVMPSVWPENMPYSLLEAMENSKTVIVSDIGGMKELIESGKNGFYFKMGDPFDLAKKINELNDFDLNKIGANAKKTVAELTLSRYARDISKFYKDLNKNK